MEVSLFAVCHDTLNNMEAIMTPTYHQNLFFLLIGLLAFDLLVAKLFLLRLWPKFKSRWRLLVYAVIIMAYIIPNYRAMFTYDPRPSPVDASLLEQLSLEQIDEWRLIAVFDSFKYCDNLRWFEMEEIPRQIRWSRAYRFTFIYNAMGVDVDINFYKDEEHLNNILPRLRHQYERRHSEVIVNDNNTQIFLHASINQRSHGAPLSFRSIRTELRLGNVHITLSEDRARDDYYPNASTAFIHLLYELLTAEPTPAQ